MQWNSTDASDTLNSNMSRFFFLLLKWPTHATHGYCNASIHYLLVCTVLKDKLRLKAVRSPFIDHSITNERLEKTILTHNTPIITTTGRFTTTTRPTDARLKPTWVSSKQDDADLGVTSNSSAPIHLFCTYNSFTSISQYRTALSKPTWYYVFYRSRFHHT